MSRDRKQSGERPSGAAIDDTITFWGEQKGLVLDREEARQVIHNLSEFFGILAEWDRKKRERERADGENASKDFPEKSP